MVTLPFNAAGAPCVESSAPEAWFTPGLTPEQAGALCTGCPVMAECLAVAMTAEGSLVGGKFSGRYGVWGGLTPDQRAALHRRRTRLR